MLTGTPLGAVITSIFPWQINFSKMFPGLLYILLVAALIAKSHSSALKIQEIHCGFLWDLSGVHWRTKKEDMTCPLAYSLLILRTYFHLYAGEAHSSFQEVNNTTGMTTYLDNTWEAGVWRTAYCDQCYWVFKWILAAWNSPQENTHYLF